MKTKFCSTVMLFCLLAINFSCASAGEQLASPNGKVFLSVSINDTNESGYGKALFTVNYKDEKSFKSILSKGILGIETERQEFCELKLRSVSDVRQIGEDYNMITGKKSHCTNQGIERIYSFENEKQQVLQIAFRVYNDGVAFRYILDGIETEHITNERTTYFIPDGTKRWMQQYAIDYEGFYPLATNGNAVDKKNANLWGYPALIEPQDSIFMLITEAGITKGNSGSRMANKNNPDEYNVQLLDEKLAFNKSFTSPWRVLIVGSLSEIVESTLVTDVSEPCKLTNTDWVIPGAAAWIYWAHNHGSRDYKTVKEYIDLAAEMKWPYNLIDWEWDVMANGGNMQDAVKYAYSKGVKPLLWYNSGTSWIGPGAPGPLDRLNTSENRRKEFAWLKEIGIAGIKVDFFAMDGANMINYYLDILEDAADYQLLINFHGAAIPRGWQRTYPHLMSVEAVYGAEWYNNRPVLTDRAAAHNATLPFTRNVVGSMYTPSSLSDIGKTMTLFKDGADDKSFVVETDISLKDKKGEIHINCLPRGGFVALMPVN